MAFIYGVRKRKHGFSLVELVVVILIIAVLAIAVFAGGSASIANARESQAMSDMENFENAMIMYSHENRELCALSGDATKDQYLPAAKEMDEYFPMGYKIQFDKSIPSSGSGIICSDSTIAVFASEKTDPWGNNYHLIMSAVDRNAGRTEYYLTITTAGGNGQQDLSSTVDEDDMFLLLQYSDGEVTTKTYNMQEHNSDGTGSAITPGITKLTSTSANTNVPRNEGPSVSDIVNGGSGTGTPGGSISGGAGGGTPGGGSPGGGAHTHNYSIATVIQSATCTQPGTYNLSCSCGAKYPDAYESPATGHTYEDGKCTVCGESDPASVPAVPGVPTAYLYNDGTMVFRADAGLAAGYDEGDILGGPYTGWDTATYRYFAAPMPPWSENWTDITKVVVESDVVTQRTNSWFARATNLVSADLGSITSIGDNTFWSCSSLESITMSPDVTSIGASAFYKCSNLALTSLPSGITSIGSHAFDGCTSLALTSLPSGVTSINSYAFQKCTSLALRGLPSGITSIGEYAFVDCTSLALTELPSSLTNIDAYAFWRCTNLTLLVFYGTPTTISSVAFKDCPNLTAITVPWANGAVANAPWGATNATINYWG